MEGRRKDERTRQWKGEEKMRGHDNGREEKR